MNAAHLIESLIVAIVVGLALGYALLALLPQIAKRRLAQVLGSRAPAWLARRLGGGGGCDSCPANQLVLRSNRAPPTD